MPGYSKIVVPVDFSDWSAEAVRHARELAARYNAPLHLLHVIERWPPAASVTDELYPMYHQYVERLNAQATKQLDELAASLSGSIPITHVTRAGNVPDEIVKYATDEHADLIVLGTHGRSGLSHWLLGSDAEKVVRTAPCPVLVVRARAPAPLQTSA